MSQLLKELAPTGVLHAAINMGNGLLVTGRAANGDPTGVSPSMAAAIAERLGVPLKLTPYAKPGEIADDADAGKWDIALIGAEPQRAEKIYFTAAYAEIEAKMRAEHLEFDWPAGYIIKPYAPSPKKRKAPSPSMPKPSSRTRACSTSSRASSQQAGHSILQRMSCSPLKSMCARQRRGCLTPWEANKSLDFPADVPGSRIDRPNVFAV